MKKNKKLIIISIVLIISLILIIAFIQKAPKISQFKNPDENVSNNNFKIENVPGVSNIKRFSDTVSRSNETINKSTGKTQKSGKVKPTPTPLPYPRISINYSLERTTSIRGIEIDDKKNNSYLVTSLDIRNYGYKYFDADPLKFRLGDLKPLLNVSTGDMLNDVVPNNSRAQGDLIFRIDIKQRWTTILTYNGGSYTIIYKIGSVKSATQGGRSVTTYSE